MTSLIFVALFPLIALIALGYGLKRKNFVDESFWKGAEKVNYYVFFPIMLFLSLANSNINLNAIEHILSVVFIVLAVSLSILYFFKYLYKTHASQFGVYVQSNIRFNTYIGLAVVYSLFQQQGMTIFAIILGFVIPIVNVFSVLALTSTNQLNFYQIIVSLLKNPLIIGAISGGIFNLTGMHLWQGLNDLLKQLAYCSLPLGLMCVGAALNFKALSNNPKPLVINTLTRLCLMPLLAYIVCNILNIPTLETQILVVFFALPTASAAYILTKVLGGDSQLMAGIISLQTLVSAFTLSIILWIFIS